MSKKNQKLENEKIKGQEEKKPRKIKKKGQAENQKHENIAN
jgi:hypothetical protein